MTAGDERLPECVKAWPECFDGGYDPRCCRFPKSCSCLHGQRPAAPAVTAHDTAVGAMALALETTNDGGYSVGWDTLAAAALATLVASPEVRAAVVDHAFWAAPADLSQDRGRSIDAVVDAVLAALTPGGAMTDDGGP